MADIKIIEDPATGELKVLTSPDDNGQYDIVNHPNDNGQYDIVNHPNHYQSETGMEVIDVVEAFTFDLKGIEATDTGNIIKYICRWSKKNGLQDLEKAAWYLNHLINHVKNLKEENK